MKKKEMARRKLLLLLKPINVYPHRHFDSFSKITNPKILHHLDDRNKVHKDAISFCQAVLRRKLVNYDTLFYNKLSKPIRNVDLVVTVGGDGTLLQASHFLDDTVPVLGVNSDPTQVEEVDKFKDEFDATRSTGYLSAATVNNFEQVLDDILEKRSTVSEISRLSICVNSCLLPTYALNDVLIAHPCPASVSRFSFRIRNNGLSRDSLINFQSSGLRVSTAAGSTAAMCSAGGLVMPILNRDLQYMVREPILTRATDPSSMHGWTKFDQVMEVTWSTGEGCVYVDGSHVSYPVQYGDTIELSSMGPVLKIFLPPLFLQLEKMKYQCV